MFRIFAKISIAMFCLWHMAAIAIWSQPTNFSNSRILHFLQNQLKYVTPYILITSQWQHWNLFPVGTRAAVNEEFLEKYENEQWTIVRTMDGDHLGFFEQGYEVVLLYRMIFEGLNGAKEPYMQDFCRSQNLSFATPVRIRRRFALIPEHLLPQTAAWWRNWKPAWSDVIDFSTTCTSPL